MDRVLATSKIAHITSFVRTTCLRDTLALPMGQRVFVVSGVILSKNFSGKKILITGGTRGIGRKMVQMFYDDGAQVFTVARSEDAIKKLREELPDVTAEVADLADWQSSRRVIESFGPMDCLVNNAGIWIPKDFMDVTEKDFNSQLNINLGAIINISQAVAKGMMERGTGGSIVNIGSTFRKHLPGGAVVLSGKVGLESLTRSMAVELGAHQIRVNCIHPGFVENTIDDYELSAEWCKANIEKLIVKRPIKFQEIGELVAFLLSPLSTMIVGEAIAIEAGYSMV